MTLPGSQSQDGGGLGPLGTSLLRTYVPIVWGAIVGYLITLLPALDPVLNGPDGATLQTAIVGVCIAVWYSLARLIEPKLPPVITRLIIGANPRPTYLGGPEGPGQTRIERSTVRDY